MKTIDKDKVRYAFLFAALWTEELESKYRVEDFVPSAVEKADQIIDHFLTMADGSSLEHYMSVFSEDQLGHDLWLSINGHGAGFFDHSQLGGDQDILQDVCCYMRDKGDKPGYINQVWVSEVGNIFIE